MRNYLGTIARELVRLSEAGNPGTWAPGGPVAQGSVSAPAQPSAGTQELSPFLCRRNEVIFQLPFVLEKN